MLKENKYIQIEELKEIIEEQKTGVYIINADHKELLDEELSYLQDKDILKDNEVTYTYYKMNNEIKLILHRPFRLSVW